MNKFKCAESTTAKKQFKYIKNFSEDNSEATILFYDAIGKFTDEDGNPVQGIDGEQFAREMLYLQNSGCETVNLRINSPGGSVVDGFSIISAIKSSKMEIHGYNDGLAASISALIYVACDFRHSFDFSILMLHNPSGSDDDGVLQKIKDSLITILKNNSVYSEDELDKILNKETYFDAEEQLSAKLCDDIIDSGEKVDVDESYDNIFELTNKFSKIINKINMKKKVIKKDLTEVENKLGLESPETLENKDKKVEDVKDEDEVMDKASIKDEDGDDDDDNDSNPEDAPDEPEEDCMNYEDMYNALMDSHNKLKNDFEDLKSERDDLSSKLDKMKDEVRKEHKKKIDLMVNNLFSEGKITSEQISSVTNLAEKDFDTVKNLFSKAPMLKNVSFKNIINSDTSNGLNHGWTIRDYEKKDPAKLAEIKNTLPGVYEKLFEDFYGEKPVK